MHFHFFYKTESHFVAQNQDQKVKNQFNTFLALKNKALSSLDFLDEEDNKLEIELDKKYQRINSNVYLVSTRSDDDDFEPKILHNIKL